MRIEFLDVSFTYDRFVAEKKTVLKNINLKIEKNEFITLIGPSGAGKTTLLQHFTGLLKPSAGMIYVDGEDIWQKNYSLATLRRKIGLVFQFPEKQLFEETVFDDVAFGPKNLNLSAEEIDYRVREAMNLLGLDFDKFKNRSPHHLSSGEKRRVAIAGVIAMAPEMLILDEPTAGLDPHSCRRILQILKSLNDQGISILLSTHYLDLAFELSQRIIALSDGQIVFDGDKDQLIDFVENSPSAYFQLPQVVSMAKKLYDQKIISDWRVYSASQLKKLIKKQL